MNPGNEPGIHWTEGWVGPSDSVDVLEKRIAHKILIQTTDKKTNMMEPNTNLQEHIVMRMSRKNLKPQIQS
jgi:hypothetical protein